MSTPSARLATMLLPATTYAYVQSDLPCSPAPSRHCDVSCVAPGSALPARCSRPATMPTTAAASTAWRSSAVAAVRPLQAASGAASTDTRRPRPSSTTSTATGRQQQSRYSRRTRRLGGLSI
jgi:hypothetical protein